MKKPDHPFYQEINHTADIGFRLTAESLTVLFERAALAMFDLILATVASWGNENTVEISASASSSDLLLREWLAELLYLHVIQKVFITAVAITEISETELTALVQTMPMSDSMNDEATEIKAVTYHGLFIHESENGFEAQIIFDT